jgi:hypothetical protein
MEKIVREAIKISGKSVIEVLNSVGETVKVDLSGE